MSVAEPQSIKYCASCGRVPTGARFDILGDQVPLCAMCTVKVRVGVGWGYYLPTKEDSPLPEGFNELYKAARVLLEENAEENEIIPTLALANHLCHGVPRLLTEKKRLAGLWGDEQAWDEEADRFARRFGGLRPVRVANEVLILERRPVLVTINYVPVRKTPEEVTISVYPHRTPLAKAGDVASLYNKTLSEAGIAHDERRTGRLSFDLHNRRLEIWIWPGTVVERTTVTEGFTVPQPGWRTDKKASFPQPRAVGELYKALAATASADGFAGDLPTRKSGPYPHSGRLILACVALLLRGWGIEGRKKIHQLLNEHVLCSTGEQLPEGYSNSEANQLWRTVRNNAIVRDPLIDAAWTLFWEGYEQ